jgi:putative transposase
MLGFKAFHSAAGTLAEIEKAHMIRKRQFGESGLSAFRQFAGLAA